jgi:hypothetical protein
LPVMRAMIPTLSTPTTVMTARKLFSLSMVFIPWVGGDCPAVQQSAYKELLLSLFISPGSRLPGEFAFSFVIDMIMRAKLDKLYGFICTD